LPPGHLTITGYVRNISHHENISVSLGLLSQPWTLLSQLTFFPW
jgi:hypothetical protein